MKHKLSRLIVTLGIVSLGFVGCSKGPEKTSKELEIVCTTYPLYDWVNTILGEQGKEAKVSLLMNNGTDLHSYQPTADDIVKIQTCDLMLYVGGPSEQWVMDALEQGKGKDCEEIKLFEVLKEKIKEEEEVEGMEESHDHDHEGEQEGEHDKEFAHKEGEHEEELDEHVWLSLNNAILSCEEITKALGTISEENKATYEENFQNYKKELLVLDHEYQEVVAQSSKKTLVFGDRFPFRYLVEDYGLNYYAAFAGCSAETEASFETVAFLAKKVDELQLGSVVVIEGSNQDLASTIVSNTTGKNQRIVKLNSMQSVTKKDIEGNITYLQVMKDNLKALKEALV